MELFFAAMVLLQVHGTCSHLHSTDKPALQGISASCDKYQAKTLSASNHAAHDLSFICTDICGSKGRLIAVLRIPETRLP